MRTYGNGSIVERNGSWQISVNLGRDPRTGRRRRQRFTVRGTRRDAQRALRDALQRKDRGLAAPTGKITVETWLTGWLARHQSEGHLVPKTHDNYRRILHRHLIPALGGLKLRELRSDHIGDMKAHLLAGGEKSTASTPLAGATVSKILGIVKTAMAEAVSAEILERNPAESVASPSGKAGRERRSLREDEIRRLIARASGTRHDIPIRFTLATGLRQSELLGLRWSSVDLEAGAVEVCQTLSYVGRQVTFQSPKTDRSRRTVELSSATIRLLASHRATQVEQRLGLGPVWQDCDLVFPNLRGGPWLPRPFYRGYRPIVDESGIEHPETADWHTLRHTAASQWIKHGVDIFTVSRRLGHAKASFTMDVYGHLLKGQQQQAAEALDYLLAEA